MRHLPHCKSYVTDSHKDAWIVLAEMAAFVKSQGRKVTVISVSIELDEDVNYYGNLVVEGG